MGYGLHIREIINADNFNVSEGRVLAQCSENVSPNPTKRR
jgi:hypothetical protein